MKREDIKAKITGITDEQLDWLMSQHGSDINAVKQQLTTEQTKVSTLTEQLNTANGKLEGYDPEWKTKAQQAKDDAQAKVDALEAGYAAERAVAGLKFSSESAKKAFLADLTAKKLPICAPGRGPIRLGYGEAVSERTPSRAHLQVPPFSAENGEGLAKQDRPAVPLPPAPRPSDRCTHTGSLPQP